MSDPVDLHVRTRAAMEDSSRDLSYPPSPEALVVPVYDNHTHLEIADGENPLHYREHLDRLWREKLFAECGAELSDGPDGGLAAPGVSGSTLRRLFKEAAQHAAALVKQCWIIGRSWARYPRRMQSDL